MSETITNVLRHAPNVRCFAIASGDLARRNSARSVKRVARAKRKRAARKEYDRWKRSVDEIINNARNQTYDDTVAEIKLLPLDAVRLAFDAGEADRLIDAMEKEIHEKTYPIGICEEFASDEVVFVWVWNDR